MTMSSENYPLSETLYFDLEHAIREHDSIIEKSGGLHGINNPGLVESVLEHIRNDDYYPDIADKATHLFYGINKNHAFTDGNKRSSIVLTAFFLEINDYGHIVEVFNRQMEDFAVHVADNRISKQLLGKIISSILYDYEFSESLKLEIINELEEAIGERS